MRLENIIGSILGYILNRINDVLSIMHGHAIFYHALHRQSAFKLVRKVKKERQTLVMVNEGYQLYSAVKDVEKIRGDIAEVGVYKGGTAKIISKAKGKKHLHLFDTFEGLPDPTKKDSIIFRRGMMLVSFEDVKKYLHNETNIHFYKGIFPASAKGLEQYKFSFVHLDVDLYESTLSCLRWFYPRMNKGGVLISHDYSSLQGVHKAFIEFFKDKPEPFIELAGSQCLVVKL